MLNNANLLRVVVDIIKQMRKKRDSPQTLQGIQIDASGQIIFSRFIQSYNYIKKFLFSLAKNFDSCDSIRDVHELCIKFQGLPTKNQFTFLCLHKFY